MAVYIVTWNLNKERDNYDAARAAFIKHLERYENKKDALDSTRWVSTSLTAQALSDDLLTKLDKNDRLFVSRVYSGQRAGWIATSIWDWINSKGA